MIKNFVLGGFAAATLAAGGSVQAAGDTGFYAGAGVGQSTVEVDDLAFDSDDTGFKLFGGYAFNRYLALEATYMNGGEPDQTISGTLITIEATSFSLAAVGRLPVTGRLSVFGRVGFTAYETELFATVQGISLIIENEDEAVSYGGGVAFQVSEPISLRVEYEQFEIDDVGSNVDLEADSRLLSLSGTFRF